VQVDLEPPDSRTMSWATRQESIRFVILPLRMEKRHAKNTTELRWRWYGINATKSYITRKWDVPVRADLMRRHEKAVPGLVSHRRLKIARKNAGIDRLKRQVQERDQKRSAAGSLTLYLRRSKDADASQAGHTAEPTTPWQMQQ